MVTEKLIQINQWGFYRNLLWIKWLNFTSWFCCCTREMRWIFRYVFLTLSQCTTLCSAKKFAIFFCKHLVRWLSVGWCFTKYFAEGSRFICCFDLPWSFAKFKLICGDLRRDYFSESLSFCLLQCSILTGTSPYFLDEWNFTLFFS